MSKITLNTVGSLVDATTAATAINNNFSTVQTAMDNTLSRDGTSPNTMSANIDMNSNRIVNLPDPINSTEPVNLRTFNLTTTGSGNVPAGGSTGQSLIKASNASYSTTWGTPSLTITGPIAVNGTVSSITAQTGTGTTFVMSAAPTITGHPTIEGVTSTGATGTGNHVFSNSPTLVTPAIGAATCVTLNGLGITSGSGVLTFQGTDTYVGRATTDTLTNKTFNSSATGNVLQVSGVTISRGQFPAESTTGSATAGNIGEYVSSSVASGSAVALTTATPANVTSISLTAGDWDVQAMPRFTGGATTTVGRLTSSISLNSATNSTVAGCLADTTYANATTFNTTDPTLAIPTVRISLSATTTVFLVALAVFGTSTCSAYGLISARRAR